jgi:hypothetical protein
LEQWTQANLGLTKAQVDTNLEAHKPSIEKKLKAIIRYAREFDEEELFKDANLIQAHQIIVARTVALVPGEQLTRTKGQLCSALHEQLLGEIVETNFGFTNKNATFQKKVHEEADKIINEIMVDRAEPRFFLVADKKRKLEEQSHICPLCSAKITSGQPYEGDHIKPWATGGKTIYSNLQVVHKKCHRTRKEGSGAAGGK